MRIQNNRPQLSINTEMPRFTVPRERIRNESGLAGPLSFAKQFRDKGRGQALRATGTYASDGDFLANHRIPGDKSVPMLSANKMKRHMQKPEINIGLMPSSPPSLEWSRGHIEVNATRHNVAVDWSGSNLASISVDQNYPVEVSLSRQSNVMITGTVPNVENKTIGRYIDRMT